MSAKALWREKRPLLLRYLAEDFSVLVIKKPRVRWVSWRRKRHVLH